MQTLAAYNPSVLLLLTTTLIALDFDQEVLYTNYTTALVPQFTFYVPIQAVGQVEHYPILTFQRGGNPQQSCVGCVQL